jgi:hypothetical protein
MVRLSIKRQRRRASDRAKIISGRLASGVSLWFRQRGSRFAVPLIAGLNPGPISGYVLGRISLEQRLSRGMLPGSAQVSIHGQQQGQC